MKKITTLALIASLIAMPAFADNDDKDAALTEETETEFASDEKLEDGFITSYINDAIASSMESASAKKDDPVLGRKLTDFASAPKFGGYFIGKYNYTDHPKQELNGGFSQRLIRLYVDGTILNDFAYRIQMQNNNNNFHMKDFFVEWKRYQEVKVKIGQFKRAFGFENPMNPWDVGTGDYSQLTKKLTGHNDYIGAESSSNGGRDQGVQIQGDLFPIGKDKHRLVHYQLMLANGQGINVSDNNNKKDYIGTFQLQPIKGLFIGAFGWLGNFTSTLNITDSKGKTTNQAVTVDRIRYMLSAKYDNHDWTFRAEYAHSYGHKISEYNAVTKIFSGNGKADAWYATVGIPCTSWLKVYGKYDVYRDGASWKKAQTIYSIAPNIQIHKNLMLQLQYNFTHDRTLTGSRHDYNEVWAETYVRF